jgi:peptidyl-prolyl cis-trans isomerase B (cyclophilin B)
MKSVLAILGLAAAFIVLSVIVQRPKSLDPQPQFKENEATDQATNTVSKPQVFNPPKEGMITAELTVKNRGVVTMEFYPKAAPKAVEQITGLINRGFYDGILIHRVDLPMVIQFGNPLTKTQGVNAGEGDTSVPMLTFEKNDLTHVPGAIGLARTSDPDSATSQLFIDMQDNPIWNGDYCVIGRVVNGLDVMKKVEKGDEITSFKLKS